jgi:hypothetical protein
MSARIIDFPDGYTNASAPVFGAGIGDGSLQPQQETPTGTVNGVNTTFSLLFTPFSEASCLVFVDGVQREKDTAWNLVVANIVFNAGYIPVTGQDIKVYYFRQAAALVVPPGSSAKSEFRTLSGAEITAKALTLIQTPTTPTEVVVSVYQGSVAFYATDYTVSGTTLSWTGLGFDGLLAAADKLVIEYHY